MLEDLFTYDDTRDSTQQVKEESISVSQLNRLAKVLLENNMPICWVKGEISGLKTYSHGYFDLKDESAKVSCVIFANNLTKVGFKLENGVKVELLGKVTLYAQNGIYQINVERIRRLGVGDLWEAYHRLLNKLKEEGLFDARHKKAIPIFPQVIGVITSKEGSVIRDVIATLKRRMPNIPIIVYHTAVQGQDAAMQIAKAIRQANNRNEVDVLIVCRGGGSQEDLWCFNEEVVAREVFASKLPIISAVGHETDTTIVDYVSDLRAPTPTSAAELVAKAKKEWEMIVSKFYTQIMNRVEYTINYKRQMLDMYYRQLRVLNPFTQLKAKKLVILNLQESLLRKILKLINKIKLRLQKVELTCKPFILNLFSHYKQISYLKDKLQLAVENRLNKNSLILDGLINSLRLLNPDNIFSRGYAVIKDKDNHIITTSQMVRHKDVIKIVLRGEDMIHAIVDKELY